MSAHFSVSFYSQFNLETILRYLINGSSILFVKAQSVSFKSQKSRLYYIIEVYFNTHLATNCLRKNSHLA